MYLYPITMATDSNIVTVNWNKTLMNVHTCISLTVQSLSCCHGKGYKLVITHFLGFRQNAIYTQPQLGLSIILHSSCSPHKWLMDYQVQLLAHYWALSGKYTSRTWDQQHLQFHWRKQPSAQATQLWYKLAHDRTHVGLPVRIRCRLFNYFGIRAVVTHQRALQSVDAGVGHDPLPWTGFTYSRTCT